MKLKRERFYNREEWPTGEWDGEADMVRWCDPATGYPCAVQRNRFGALCGYVAVPLDHPLAGAGYDRRGIDVHGGLTYAGGDPLELTKNLCWFGFDCGHFMDVMPAMVALFEESKAHVAETHPGLAEMLDPWPMEYRNMAYVRGEVTSLARQLKEMAR